MACTNANCGADNSNWPVQRGFEKFYGTIRGYGNFYDPRVALPQNTFITPGERSRYRPRRSITRGNHRQRGAVSASAPRGVADQPFFFYSPTRRRTGDAGVAQDIAKYRGKYDEGYAPVRQARLQRLRELGLLPAGWQPAPLAGDWDAVKRKPWEARCMEVYAAMIDNMDQGIGRVLAELKRIGQFDNTVILYLNDNGACAETMGRKPLPEPPADD
jgi:arylsulfatase